MRVLTSAADGAPRHSEDGAVQVLRVLDPLGASVANGPDLYFTILLDMAKAVRACLSDAG